MYEDMLKEMQDKMKPVSDIAEINKSTAERLISLQSEYLTDMFNSGLAQMKALSEVKEPKSAMELQIKYFKEMEAKLTNVAEQEIAALSSAREKLTDIIEKSVADMAEMPAMGDMASYLKETQEKFMAEFKNTQDKMLNTQKEVMEHAQENAEKVTKTTTRPTRKTS